MEAEIISDDGHSTVLPFGLLKSISECNDASHLILVTEGWGGSGHIPGYRRLIMRTYSMKLSCIGRWWQSLLSMAYTDKLISSFVTCHIII